MSGISTTTNNNGLEIVIDKKLEVAKGENWRIFGVSLYHSELQFQTWSQQIIATIPAPSTIEQLPEFEQKLTKAKSDLTKLKEIRLSKTGVMNDVISRLMNPEKSVDDHIAKISHTILSLKQQLKQQTEKNKAKQDETSRLTESIIKHVADMDSQLRNANIKLIDDAYVYALSNISPEALPVYIAKVKARVTEKTQTIPKPTWNSEIITVDEINSVVEQMFKPKQPSEFVKEFNKKIDFKFSDYEVAFKNKTEALRISKEDSEKEKANLQQENLQSHVAASFVAGASSVSTPTIAGVKELKKVYKLQIEETQANAILIMTAFVANLNLCIQHLRVSKWFGLSIKQMIGSLEKVKTDDNNFSYTGLIFEETDKL